MNHKMTGVTAHERDGTAHRGAPASSVGQLLRRYRSLAGLTQEELAERSGYSAQEGDRASAEARASAALAVFEA